MTKVKENATETAKTAKETKRTKTDATESVEFTIHSLSELTDLDADQITRSVNFVKRGANQAGLELVEQWIDTGIVLAQIKKTVEKKQFKTAIDTVYGTHFNNNNRAYSQRLAEQDKGELVTWYISSNETATSPKMVFERFFKALPTQVVNAPKPRKAVVNPSSPEPKNGEEVKPLVVSQALTTYAQLDSKCREDGNMDLATAKALLAELDKVRSELAEFVKIEEKAQAVSEHKAGKSAKNSKKAA